MNVTAFGKLKSALNDGGFCSDTAADLADDVGEAVRDVMNGYQIDSTATSAVRAFEDFLEQHRGMTVDQLIDEFRQLRATRGDA